MTPFETFVLGLFEAGDQFGAYDIAVKAFRPAGYGRHYINHRSGEIVLPKTSLKNLAKLGELVDNGDQTFSLPS